MRISTENLLNKANKVVRVGCIELYEAFEFLYPKVKPREQGSGLYSEVFQHPKHRDRVIKVFKENGYLSAYGTYLYYVLMNPKFNNKRCLPRVFDVTVIANSDPQNYVVAVTLEKLMEIGDFYLWPKKYEKNKMRQHPIIKEFYTKFKGHVAYDLHSGNVMFRKGKTGKLQYVLTDPFCDP